MKKEEGEKIFDLKKGRKRRRRRKRKRETLETERIEVTEVFATSAGGARRLARGSDLSPCRQWGLELSVHGLQQRLTSRVLAAHRSSFRNHVHFMYIQWILYILYSIMFFFIYSLLFFLSLPLPFNEASRKLYRSNGYQITGLLQSPESFGAWEDEDRIRRRRRRRT